VLEAGNKQVLLALSGGVDSSTLAFLMHKAIGDQLSCVFIDQGFMRKYEPERLLKLFQEQFHIPVEYVNARDRFLAALGWGHRSGKKNAALSDTNSSVYLKKHPNALVHLTI
jgi:GMP synthase PP-ATPase subunit